MCWSLEDCFSFLAFHFEGLYFFIFLVALHCLLQVAQYRPAVCITATNNSGWFILY